MQLDLHVVIETSRLCLVQCLYAITLIDMQLDLHVVIETSRLCLVQCLYAWLSCGLLISDIHMQCHIIVS